MNSLLLIVFPALWGSLSAASIFDFGASNPTLRLVHVLFRHGDRNPTEGSILKDSIYKDASYYPEGFGQLTNKGKETEYNLGNVLRSRYNDFLTDTWKINYLDTRSTNVNRTKMSAELMLAGLYPPRGNQIWSLLFWQPIPINYFQSTEDKELSGDTACRDKSERLHNEIENSAEITAYKDERYRLMFALLDRMTEKTNTFSDAWNWYMGFTVQKELGHELDTWVPFVYPEPLRSATLDYYRISVNTTAQKRIMSGYLVKKILADTKRKIDGTIYPAERKMFIYSAHEMNVATMLLSLNAIEVDDVPPYGSYILFEVHEIDGVWGLKLFYQNYVNKDPIALSIPGCAEFCPYDQFYSLVEDILPVDDSDCFDSKEI